VIALLALVIGALLNAPGMHKSAYNQRAGWKRDVSLAITGPLADVSHALLLDRPRKGLQALLGRSHDDSINTAIAITPLPSPQVATATPTTSHGPAGSTKKPLSAKPHKLAFSPKHKLRLWIAGDSLVITPGWAIVRAAGRARAIQPVGQGPDGRVATGLERPDVFNWFQQVTDRVRELKPHAVVFDFGGNDDHGYMTGLPKGVSIGEFGSRSWRREYSRRVGGLMDIANRAGAFVVWIGLPVTRSSAQTERFDTINAVVQAAARKRHGRVAYIDTYRPFAPAGEFEPYLTDDSGDQVLVRAPDGVHFAPAGGDIIARMVLHALNDQFDLTSWRKRRSP
jgi:hypothetical protein